MLFVVSLILVLLALFYAGLIAFFALGFQRVRRQAASSSPSSKRPFVSVVLAARNEEANIETCLQSIAANTYPIDRFEIIVVDDFSTDTTASLVTAWIAHRPSESPSMRLLRMKEYASAPTGRKQEALNQGIAAARGTWILTTDADCTVGSRWIETMASQMSENTGFVAGPVRYRPGSTLFGNFQALEFLALVATGAGGVGMGRPNMCNSANVAYRRSVHNRFADSLDGPAADEILAQRLADETDWTVSFCAHPDALVETEPLLRFRDFWRQRRRWAGTGPRYPRRSLVAAILGVYTFYMVLLGAALAVPFTPALAPAVLVALGLKIGSELLLLVPACRHFRQPALLRYYLPEQPLQILYVVCIGAAAALAPPRWEA